MDYDSSGEIINELMMTYTQTQFQITDESQSGFSAGYSAIDILQLIMSSVSRAWFKVYISKPGGRYYVLYVDLKKKNLTP